MSFESDLLSNNESLVDVIRRHAQLTPDRTAIVFHESNGDISSISFSAFDEKIKSIAYELQKSYQPHERVILIYPPGIELITAFFGCLYAKMIAVPVYPPHTTALIDKLSHILEDSKPCCILSTASIIRKYQWLRHIKYISTLPLIGRLTNPITKKWLTMAEWEFDKFSWIATDKINIQQSSLWRDANVTKQDIAFLQYTSGSTGHPKGVMLSHLNLLSNLDVIINAGKITKDSVCISWLPPYHDMGLIGTIIMPLCASAEIHLVSPFDFLKHPTLWIKLINDYRGQITGGPNFAYDYTIAKFNPNEFQEIDLSSLRYIYNGAEPINYKVIKKFYDYFSPYGFHLQAMSPCYGLAEATLMVSATPADENITTLHISKNELRQNIATIHDYENNGTVTLVSSGKPQVPIKIVNPSTHTDCNDNEIGEIWVSGLGVAKGYFRKESDPTSPFNHRIKNDPTDLTYLRTGDLGFLHNGYLYVTGRIKDLIKIHGSNYYPQDIEQTVSSSHPAIRTGATIACSIDVLGSEKVIIVSEIKLEAIHGETTYREICEAIINDVSKHHELAPYDILLVKKHTIPKTTSGKVRRSETKRRYLEKTFKELYRFNKETEKLPAAPLNDELSEAIREILVKAYHNDNISLDKSFLSQGGDSIIAAEIISEVEDKFGVKIEHDNLYTDKSFRLIFDELNIKSTQSSEALNPPSKHHTNRLLSPISHEQLPLWQHYKIHPRSNNYNILAEISINGEIDKDKMIKSLKQTVRTNKILSSRFIEIDGDPYLEHMSSTDFEIELIEINDPQKSETTLQKIRESLYNHLFDLTISPLIKSAIIKTAHHTYTLMIVIPHIIIDGHSINILIDEIVNAYHSRETDKSAYDYFNYCDWQSENLQQITNTINKASTASRQPSQTLMLPYKKAVNRHEITSASDVAITIEKNTLEKLTQAANKYKVSPNMLFITALSILLSKYTGQDDIVIGVPVSTRSKKEFNKTLGYFVNVMPLHLTLNHENSLSFTLQSTREKIFELFNHKNTLITDQDHSSDNKHFIDTNTPIQLVFVWQEKWDTKIAFDQHLANLKIYNYAAKYEIAIEAIPTESGITIRFEYATALFDDYVIKQMTRHYQALLHQIASKSDSALSLYSLYNDDDLMKLQRLQGSYEPLKSFPRLETYLKNTIKQKPNTVALFDSKSHLTYQQLETKTNRVASYLLQNNFKQGDVIGILLDRSINYIVSIIGILKAGCVCLPLDCTLPPERIKHMLLDSNAKGFVSSDGRTGLNAIEPCHAIHFEDMIKHEINDVTFPNLTSNAPAYIIYTSGSTGTPKGVILTHSNLSSRIEWVMNNIKLSEQDKFLHQFIFTFDVAIKSLWWPIAAGVPVFIPNTHELRNVHDLTNIIHKHNINIISSIPSVLIELLPTLNLDQIRIVVSGGELFPKKLTAIANTTDIAFYNLYGPTEASIFSSYYQLPKPCHQDEIPIGQPITDTTIHLLDQSLQPVPLYATGEIYIGGAGISPGYLNLPEQSENQFSHHLYKTGDLGRYRDDGNIEYLGRVDNQLKIHGYRIEPEAIESIIEQIDGIEESAVIVRTYPNKRQALTGFIVKKTHANLDKRSIIEFLEKHLSKAAIPAELIDIGSLPRLANGKKDRKAIQDINLTNPTEYHPPSDKVENELYQLWQARLGHQDFDIDTDFSYAGGNSLLGVLLISDINNKFATHLTVDTLISHPTIREQAQALKNIEGSSAIVVPLAGNKNNELLICIHPIGGTMYCYKELAALTKKQFHIIGIQSPQHANIQLNPFEIETIIDFYISKLDNHLNNQPLTLLGWSAGGLIVNGMIQKLYEMKIPVKQACLIDTNLLSINKIIEQSTQIELINHFLDMMVGSQFQHSGLMKMIATSYIEYKMPKGKINSLTDLFNQLNLHPNEKQLHLINHEINSIIRNLLLPHEKPYQLDALLSLFMELKLIPRFIDKNSLQRYFNIFRENVIALSGFEPRYMPGKIVYFKSTLTPPLLNKNNWNEYCDDIQIIPINEKHEDMLKSPAALNIISTTLLRQS